MEFMALKVVTVFDNQLKFQQYIVLEANFKGAQPTRPSWVYFMINLSYIPGNGIKSPKMRGFELTVHVSDPMFVFGPSKVILIKINILQNVNYTCTLYLLAP